MNKETGGAAFPGHYMTSDGKYHEYQVDVPGMTLRDYFAAQAMQSYLITEKLSHREIAERAYITADAMIAERAKEK